MSIVSPVILEAGLRITKHVMFMFIAAAVTLALDACGGSDYSVESLGNSADERLSGLADQEQLTFAELLDDADCARVVVVGPYDTVSKEALIPHAAVDVSAQDQFTVIVAFSEQGEVLRAVRVSNASDALDLTQIAPHDGPCDATIMSTEGRAMLVPSS